MESSERAEHQPDCPVPPQLSVVLPAYNEADRIGAAVNDIIHGIPASIGAAWELIVVNDGSSDDTSAVAGRFEGQVPCLRVIDQPVNQGKGAAVRAGVLASRGDFVLFADADGATPFVESHALLEGLQDGADISVGTRVHRNVKRSLPRLLMSSTFRLAVRWIVKVRVSDPQCGFKMFCGDHARQLFRLAGETGYLFDLEILGLAQSRGLTIQEFPITWREIPGSHVRIIRDSWRMFQGLWRVRSAIRSARGTALRNEAARATVPHTTTVSALPAASTVIPSKETQLH